MIEVFVKGHLLDSNPLHRQWGTFQPPRDHGEWSTFDGSASQCAVPLTISSLFEACSVFRLLRMPLLQKSIFIICHYFTHFHFLFSKANRVQFVKLLDCWKSEVWDILGQLDTKKSFNFNKNIKKSIKKHCIDLWSMNMYELKWKRYETGMSRFFFFLKEYPTVSMHTAIPWMKFAGRHCTANQSQTWQLPWVDVTTTSWNRSIGARHDVRNPDCHLWSSEPYSFPRSKVRGNSVWMAF